MATPTLPSNGSPPPQPKQDEEDSHQTTYQHYRDAVSALPVAQGWWNDIRRFDNWIAIAPALVSTMVAQRHFQARPTDILVASIPKSGVTWLKALLFATVNRRASNSVDLHHLLERLSPHDCVPFLELQVYIEDKIPDLGPLPDPRLFATHIPFKSLPASVAASGCKIVYIARNPKDNFVSFWHMANKLQARDGLEPLSVEAGFDMFRRGVSPFGPYWDHLLGYWKAHLEGPNEVLFLRYEQLIEDPKGQLKRLAEFVGAPFTAGEEEEGVVEGIVRLCGFESLSNLEVNKAGATRTIRGEVDNRVFFRRGGVGDWVNHLTPEMAKELDEITEGKLEGSGLRV